MLKTKLLLICPMMLISFLAACAEPTPEPATTEDMIALGDTVGEMRFTRIDEVEYGYGFEAHCDEDKPNETDPTVMESNCEIDQGSWLLLNCMGLYADSVKELDKIWREATMIMTVDDQPVNLPTFGTLDLVAHWDSDVTVRIWTVVIENLSAGQHEIVCQGSSEDEAWEHHKMLTVLEPPEALTTIPLAAVAGQHAYTSEESDLDFLLYIPEEYEQESGYEWPLILFLHGHVDGLQNTGQVRRQSLPAVLESEPDFPFIVVSPLRQEGRGDFKYWFRDEHVSPLFGLIEEIEATYPVDPQRIYLSGESAGGNGVWEIGSQYPDRFAALAPVSGYYGYPFEVPDNICDLKEVPVWAFHGALDELVPLEAEQSLVDALNECGGQAQITVFPDLGHDLDFEQVYTAELAEWLFSFEMAE